VNELAAAVLAAGELICEFQHGFRRSVFAGLGEAPRADVMLVYEALAADSAQVVSSERPGRNAVRVRATDRRVHLIEPAGPSVRVTTITGCSRHKWKHGAQTCVRFSARYAWHFDTLAVFDPDRSLERLPSGSSTGACEPWKVD
jgi:hypothetical protein